jgi:hypothetical protein
MNRLVKSAAVLAASVVGVLALWGLATRPGPEVRALQEERRELLEQRERLRSYVGRLTERRRVAQVLVTGQHTDDAGRVATTLTFQEVDENERPITDHTFTVPSDFVYFDALVIRFDESLIDEPDQPGSRSLALFRRIFGETQPPEEGYPIDPPDQVPQRYRAGPGATPAEQQLWQDFWTYVRHPEQAHKVGVRVAQCEAVGAPMKTGDFWVLELERDGGLNLIRQSLPGLIQQVLRGQIPGLSELIPPPNSESPAPSEP